MFFTKFLLAASALAVAAAQLGVQTPAALVECQPVALTFSGGTAPYYLSVIPGGQVSAAALVNFGTVTASPYTWSVNLASGTSITIKITDSTGTTAYSAPVTIQAGSSSDCLTSSVAAASTTVTTGVIASLQSSASAAGASATSAAATSVASASTVTSVSSVSSASAAASSAVSSTSSAVSSSVAAATSSAAGVVGSATSAAASAVSAATSAVASVAASSGNMVTKISSSGVVAALALGLGLFGGAAVLL